MPNAIPAQSSPAAIELSHVTRSFGDVEVIAPTDISIGESQFVSLLGPSGSGKSTLLRIIAGLDFPSAGQATTHGRAITGPGPDRAMVFQDHALLPWKTALANVEFGLRSARPELSAEQRTQRAQQQLELVGLHTAQNRYPDQLSGGMRQRVGIARAFALEPEILLLDEPFGALDALTRRELQLQLLDSWDASRRTVVMVTHDVDEAILLSDRVLVLSQGPSAHVLADIPVTLPRPRHGVDAANSEFARLRHEMLELLEH